MFSFYQKKTLLKKAVFAGLTLFLMMGLVFVSCSDSPGGFNLVDAAAPIISGQPQGATWDVSTAFTKELSVTASVIDGGTLSYQWYENDSNSAVISDTNKVAGATSDKLTLKVQKYHEDGGYYFYVVVTNTNNSATGAKTASITSNVATVTVTGGDNPNLVNADYPDITGEPAYAAGTWNVYATDSVELDVTAIVTDGGILSYQWYRNTVESAHEAVKVGAMNSPTSPLTLTAASYKDDGDYYFYVEVTNTINNNGDGGNKSHISTSEFVQVTVIGNDEFDYKPEDIPADLIGTWVGIYPGEEYIITATTFTAEGAYAGTIVGHRSNGNAGYITIEYTEAEYYPNAAGNFYVIHYKDLDSSADPMTVSMAGAYSPDYLNPDPEFTDGKGGKATQAAAEKAYTVTAGYFGIHTEVAKMGGGGEPFPNTIPGFTLSSATSQATPEAAVAEYITNGYDDLEFETYDLD